MDAWELIRLHCALECKGIDDDNQLYRIPCADPDTLFRIYVVRYDRDDTLLFRADLPAEIRKKLLRLPVADFFEFPERVTAILAEHGPSEERHIGKSYIFPPASVTPNRYPDVVPLSQLAPAVVKAYDPEIDLGQNEIFGVLADGQIVSTCQSSRENDAAGEAWVRTLEPYRRRGYARQVTAAWANWLLQHGKVPFYSHTWTNLASEAVAQALGLTQYLADAGYA